MNFWPGAAGVPTGRHGCHGRKTRHRDLSASSKRRTQTIRVRLAAGHTPLDNRTGYALETVLCALGLPYDFSVEAAGRCGGHEIYLSLDSTELLAPGSIPPGSVVVQLPELSGRTPAAGHQQPAVDNQRSSLTRVFSDLSREEEYQTDSRDEHDRFGWAHSAQEASGLGARPWVSEYALQLLARIEEACDRSALPTIRKEFWPHGKAFAASLTHDVDVVRRGKLPRGVAVRDVTSTISSAARGRLGLAARQAGSIVRTALSGRDPYWTFDRISSLERSRGHRSTYFFMVGTHYPEDASYNLRHPLVDGLLKRLRADGCEIGLHGSYTSYQDSQQLRRMKAQLEERLGDAVVGHRNHFLRLRAPDSWRAQDAAGFSYDATLGFHDREGFRGGHAFPFHPYDPASGRAMDLLEMPLALMEVTLHKYRRLRGEKAREAMLDVLERARAVHGLATLLWHNDTFYDPDYPGCGGLYESALEWLEKTDAYVAPLGEIDRWWRARAAVRLSPLPEGATGWRMECPLEIEGLVLRLHGPDPGPVARVGGGHSAESRRDGRDQLLEFGRLPAGADVRIEYR